MNCFFDTSALIKNYIDERGSSNVAGVMAQADAIHVSEVSIVECFSTLRRILQEQSLNEEEYEIVKREIKHDFRYFTIIPVEAVIGYCESIIDSYRLKTLDSIQLASARHVYTEIDYSVCCDKRLSEAAMSEQLVTIDPAN